MKLRMIVFPLFAIVLLSGCEPPHSTQRVVSSTSAGEAEQQLLAWVADNLRVHEEIAEGDILQQITDRLNQWRQTQGEAKLQKSPEILQTLPAELREIGPAKRITAPDFTPIDVVFMQDTTWLKGAAEVARQESPEELQAGENVFDWIVRNIQLESPGKNRVPHYVSEVLFFGRGTAEERAWLFVSMCRQLHLSAVMLAIQKEDAAPTPWACGLVVDQKLYLFDPWLGLALRSVDGKSVATLTELRANPALLRNYDWNAEHPYPVTEEDLGHVVIWLEGSPGFLSVRLQSVEKALTGSDRLRLSVDVDALTKQLESAAPEAKIALWPLPYRVLRAKTPPIDEAIKVAASLELAPFRFKVPAPATKKKGRENERSFVELNEGLAGGDMSKSQNKEVQSGDLINPLRLGRVQELRGNYRPPHGAIPRYDWARDPRFVTEIDAAVEHAASDPQSISPEDAENIKKLQPVIHEVSNSATYWKALVMYDRGEYDTADYHFGLVLKDRSVDKWRSGASYNKARSLEAKGSVAEAAKRLAEDTTSPQSHGNQIRARQLQKKE